MTNIEFHSVTKEYKNHVKALDAVSFSIESGVWGLHKPSSEVKSDYSRNGHAAHHYGALETSHVD